MGEITREELSEELYNEIISASSSEKISIESMVLISDSENQRIFILPFNDFNDQSFYLDIKINSTWISPDKYNISENKLAFNSTVTMDKDTKIYITLFKNIKVVEDYDPGILPPDNVTNFKATPLRNRDVAISWTDPDDVDRGKGIQQWEGTKIVRKVGSYPKNENDGVILLNTKERNKYSKNPFIDKSLSVDLEYFYQAFPYYKKSVNTNNLNRVSCIPKKYKIMGVQIDLNEENLEKIVTYTDDAVGMQPGSNEWDEFFGHKPCIFKEGKVVGYLKKDNFRQYENGEDIDTDDSGADKSFDVMIEFPRRGLHIERKDNIITLKMTDCQDDPDFKYLAHSKLTNNVKNFYLGAYKGCVTYATRILTSRTISRMGDSVSQDINYFREAAHRRGNGYEIMGFYQLTFIQSMFLLKYKNTRPQDVLGKGFSGSILDWDMRTGGTSNFGMDYGSLKIDDHVKLFGLEDIYGIAYELLDGITIRNDRHIITSTSNFTNGHDGYVEQSKITDGVDDSYLTSPFGTTELGFIPQDTTYGTSNTFYAYTSLFLSSNGTAGFGGEFGSSKNRRCSLFNFRLPISSRTEYPYMARLMYI